VKVNCLGRSLEHAHVGTSLTESMPNSIGRYTGAG
jgi:hypothetical protein